MTEEERDNKITEMYTDIKWLKDWAVEHKSIHTRYHLMIWVAIVGAAISLIIK